MFIIRNITQRDVVLDDLRLVLGPEKQIDLDKVASRHNIEASEKLKLAVHQKRIKVISKDTDQIVEKPVPVEPVQPTMSAETMNKFMEEIRKEIAKSQALPVELLSKQMQDLAEQLKRAPVAPQAQATPQNETTAPEDTMPEDVMAKLHAKSVSRLEKSVTGHVEHETQTVKDDGLQNNIDELDKLI